MNLILEIAFFLIILLAVLLALLFRRAKIKKALCVQTQESVESLEVLFQRMKSAKVSATELEATLDLVLEHYGKIDDFTLYEKILFSITLHPNTNKKIILNFDKQLSLRNPSFKKAISNAITDALKAR